jgi:hypothetical protein
VRTSSQTTCDGVLAQLAKKLSPSSSAAVAKRRLGAVLASNELIRIIVFSFGRGESLWLLAGVTYC